MKFTLRILTLCGLIAMAFSAPLDDSAKAQILCYDFDNIGVDGYDFSFETSDGVRRKESAELKDFDDGKKALTVDGFAVWTAPDNKIYRLDYVANEKGFQPKGDHLPR